MEFVSIIIPTYNRLSRLKQVIAALEAQQHPHDAFEVIIVSDGSTDGTHEYLQQLVTPLKLQWTTQQNSGPAAARNNGVSRAQGEYILFIDDDVVPQPQLIAEHMRIHQASAHEIVVLGPMLTPEGFAMAPWVRWEQAMLMKQYSAMERGDLVPTARQFYTGNASLRRSHIIALNGFNENFRRAEDVELAYRLAERDIGFTFNPAAVGMHYAERSFRSWLDISYTYGRNDVIFARAYRQVWILDAVRMEFGQRHWLNQLITRLCLGRPTISIVVIGSLKLTAKVATWLGINSVCKMAFSGLFNLLYYQGFADEFGDTSFLAPSTTNASPSTR
jgi:glycosyltransferase involved in cell wall biosynthesis